MILYFQIKLLLQATQDHIPGFWRDNKAVNYVQQAFLGCLPVCCLEEWQLEDAQVFCTLHNFVEAGVILLCHISVDEMCREHVFCFFAKTGGPRGTTDMSRLFGKKQGA